MKAEAMACLCLTFTGLSGLTWWALHLMGHRVRNIGNANPPFHS